MKRRMSCRWCGAELVDEHGRPRWDVFGADLAFVCRDRCQPRLVAPYRWHSDPRPVTTKPAPVLAGARHG